MKQLLAVLTSFQYRIKIVLHIIYYGWVISLINKLFYQYQKEDTDIFSSYEYNNSEHEIYRFFYTTKMSHLKLHWVKGVHVCI